MKLYEITVRNPITTLMFFIAVLVFGILANLFLPRDVFPDIELPTLTVVTVYPGASSENVEEQITKPLEKILAGTEDLKEIKSYSRENVSLIALQFSWGTNITNASANVRDLIEVTRNDLPTEARAPFIMKINTSIMPVVILGVNSNEDRNNLTRIIDDQISSELRKIDGVGTVMTIAQPEREIQIIVDPLKLQHYNITIQQIATYLKAENINIPGGSIKTEKHDISISIPGDIETTDDLENIIIGFFNGSNIVLSDIANIRDTYKDKDEIARTGGKRSVAVMVQKQSGSNTLDVYNKIIEVLPLIRKTLPKDISVQEVFNTSEVINESLNNLGNTIWLGGLWVIFVVLIFLRRIRSSLIIALTIPFSLIFSFIVMYLLGYTINVFSLMSLVVAIGMVVDNAIVVLENISRHIENGTRPREASIFGTGEMGLAITASTFTTIAVLFPLIFAGGIVGIMFKQLAIITASTLLASLFVSLTLTPMLCSKLLKPVRSHQKRGKFFTVSEKLFLKTEKAYSRFLQFALRNRWKVVIINVAVLGLSLLLIPHIGTDYIPDIDAGDVVAIVRLPEGVSTTETERMTERIEKIFTDNVPEIRYGFSVAGQTEKGILSSIGFSEGKNISTIAYHLCPPDERERSAQEIAAIITNKLNEIPEIDEFHVTGGSILASGLLGNIKPIEIEIRGNSLVELDQLATVIEDSLKSMPFLINVENSANLNKPEYQILIDRNKANTYGLNTAMIAMQVRQSIYGTNAGTFREQGKEYDIVIRYADEYRKDPSKLNNIMIQTLRGTSIPLSEVATIKPGSGPLEIAHDNQKRIVKVSASLNNISLGEAVSKVQSMVDHVDHTSGTSIVLAGQVNEQQDSFGNMSIIFLIGIMLVFMIMASQFESLKNPFIILFSIPFTLIGVIWAFEITGLTLSVVTFVGIIMLVGIVVNNGIVLVDYINLLIARNNDLNTAISEAGQSRLRPVLMTTFTTILGMIPMALSTGLGSELWSPLGITLIGGLLISTLVTLILMPVLYSLMNSKKLKK